MDEGVDRTPHSTQARKHLKTLQTLYEPAISRSVWKITTFPAHITKYTSSISNSDIDQTTHTCNLPSHNPLRRLKSNHIPKVLAETRAPETHLLLVVLPKLLSSLASFYIISRSNQYHQNQICCTSCGIFECCTVCM